MSICILCGNPLRGDERDVCNGCADMARLEQYFEPDDRITALYEDDPDECGYDPASGICADAGTEHCMFWCPMQQALKRDREDAS